MGTAIEMWEAYQHGAAVITISPLKHNWAVKFLSHAIYLDMATFEAALASTRARWPQRIELRAGAERLPAAALSAPGAA